VFRTYRPNPANERNDELENTDDDVGYRVGEESCDDDTYAEEKAVENAEHDLQELSIDMWHIHILGPRQNVT